MKRTIHGSSQILAVGFLLSILWPLTTQSQTLDQKETQFKPIRTQFIAALGDPTSSSGTNAQDWGIWRVDPGPRGVRLNRYSQLEKTKGVAPTGWQFNSSDWWLEEHGLIMEAPDFPLPVGKYLVTADREVTTTLTIYEKDNNGNQRWELAEGALYDVTHLPCRSARYTPASETLDRKGACSPAKANRKEFPVTPGAAMPEVEGCDKLDYAVLFIIGVAQ